MKQNNSGYLEATPLSHAAFTSPAVALLHSARTAVHIINLASADTTVMPAFDVNSFNVAVALKKTDHLASFEDYGIFEDSPDLSSLLLP